MPRPRAGRGGHHIDHDGSGRSGLPPGCSRRTDDVVRPTAFRNHNCLKGFESVGLDRPGARPRQSDRLNARNTVYFEFVMGATVGTDAVVPDG